MYTSSLRPTRTQTKAKAAQQHHLRDLPFKSAVVLRKAVFEGNKRKDGAIKKGRKEEGGKKKRQESRATSRHSTAFVKGAFTYQ